MKQQSEMFQERTKDFFFRLLPAFYLENVSRNKLVMGKIRYQSNEKTEIKLESIVIANVLSHYDISPSVFHFLELFLDVSFLYFHDKLSIKQFHIQSRSRAVDDDVEEGKFLCLFHEK